MLKPACIQSAQKQSRFCLTVGLFWLHHACRLSARRNDRALSSPRSLSRQRGGCTSQSPLSLSSWSYCQGAIILWDALMCWRNWLGFFLLKRGRTEVCKTIFAVCSVFVHLSLAGETGFPQSYKVIWSCFYCTFTVQSENKDVLLLLYDCPDDCLAKMYRRPCSRHLCLFAKTNASICLPEWVFTPDWTAEANKIFSKQQKGSLMQTPETDTCLSTYIHPVLVFISSYCCNFGSFFMKLEAVEVGLESVVENLLLLMSKTFVLGLFFFLGIAIASALVDISQQRAMDFKERGLNLKHRKHTVHHQGTCVWTWYPWGGDCTSYYTMEEDFTSHLLLTGVRGTLIGPFRTSSWVVCFPQ